MDSAELEEVLTKLADIEQGIDDYLNYGQIEALQQCINDSSYDDIWPLRFQCHSKYDIWEIMRLDNAAQTSFFRPYAQINFRCNRRMPANHIPCISLVYAYRGSVECEFEDEYFVLKEHQLLVINSNAIIHLSATNTTDFYINIFFNLLYLTNVMLHRFPSDSLFTRFFEQALYGVEHGMSYLIFDIEKEPRATDYFLTAVETLLTKPECHEEIVSSLIFLHFCELMKLSGSSKLYLPSASANITTYDIINYISLNYKTVTLASIAEHFHFHPDYMRKTIKQLMNKNFIDVVQDIRLTAACQLLRDTDLPISQIISESGYQNNSHFYMLFKKRYHCSPAEYRQSKRQHP